MPLPEVIRNVAIAQTALKEGQLKQAGEVATRILADRPLHIPAELILIEAAEMENDHWLALERYEKILNRVPQIPSVESRAATLAQKMGAFELAECHVERALRVQPQDGYLHHILAGILHARKKTIEALKEAKQAVNLGYQTASAYVSLGNLYSENMEIAPSIDALKKAVEIDPHAAENLASFALSALTVEQYGTLRNILEAHIQANPQNINTLYSLALMHLNENQLEKAKEYFLRLEKLAPEHPQVHYNLGLLYFRIDENDQGQKAMARFEELKQQEARDFREHTEAFKTRLMAEDAFQKKDFEQSVRLYLRLLAEDRVELKDLVNLGKSYARIQKVSEALDSFERALNIDPVSTDALSGASEMARILKKTNLADLYERRFHLITKSCDSLQ
jgi:tetratricopeptide (TPR) repeat protein